jgi:hypothetical protein
MTGKGNGLCNGRMVCHNGHGVVSCASNICFHVITAILCIAMGMNEHLSKPNNWLVTAQIRVQYRPLPLHGVCMSTSGDVDTLCPTLTYGWKLTLMQDKTIIKQRRTLHIRNTCKGQLFDNTKPTVNLCIHQQLQIYRLFVYIVGVCVPSDVVVPDSNMYYTCA